MAQEWGHRHFYKRRIVDRHAPPARASSFSATNDPHYSPNLPPEEENLTLVIPPKVIF
jgi:hypothetical protein